MERGSRPFISQLGSENFKHQQVERTEGKWGDHHAGQMRQDPMQAKAERIVAEGLRRLSWSERDWLQRPRLIRAMSTKQTTLWVIPL